MKIFDFFLRGVEEREFVFFEERCLFGECFFGFRFELLLYFLLGVR